MSDLFGCNDAWMNLLAVSNLSPRGHPGQEKRRNEANPAKMAARWHWRATDSAKQSQFCHNGGWPKPVRCHKRRCETKPTLPEWRSGSVPIDQEGRQAIVGVPSPGPG